MTHTSTHLHSLWLRFKKGLCDERGLAEGIYRHVLNNPGRFTLANVALEERHDLLASMYTRLIKAIHAYSQNNSSFDAYIHSIIHWQKVERKRQECSLVQGEAIAWRYRHLEELRDNETRYPGYLAEKIPVKSPLGSKKQHLILLLKLCPTLSDGLVERFASCTGIPSKTLFAMVEQVKTIYMGVSGRLDYERKREEYWARIVLLQGQLDSDILTSRERSVMEGKLALTKTRLANLKRRQGPQAAGVRNWIIARVLGISQSSVSSSLRAFRRLVSHKEGTDMQPEGKKRVNSCIPADGGKQSPCQYRNSNATSDTKHSATPLPNPV